MKYQLLSACIYIFRLLETEGAAKGHDSRDHFTRILVAMAAAVASVRRKVR